MFLPGLAEQDPYLKSHVHRFASLVPRGAKADCFGLRTLKLTPRIRSYNDCLSPDQKGRFAMIIDCSY